MKKRGVPRRCVRKYKTKPFDGNELEKAYLIGLRLGDLNVKLHRKQILVRTSTSHLAMLELFHSVFQRYSRVHQFPLFRPVKKPHFHWQVYTLLDKSFEFMLNKVVPDEITASDSMFHAFLAGYTDAEGCILVTPNGQGTRFYFQLASEDIETLSVIAAKLKEAGYHFTLRISARKGESHGHKYNKDYWELRIATKADVVELLKRLEFRHREKIQQKTLVLGLQGVKKWSDAKEKVATLRMGIQEEVNKCVREAEEKFRQKFNEENITTVKQINCLEQKT